MHSTGWQINLNVGCPSWRGQDKCVYGAVLMKDPRLVASCMSAILDEVGAGPGPAVPCTVKCRIGVDDDDRYEDLRQFVEAVHVGTAGRVDHFIVHARKAILGVRLSPEQNRTIPPLRHEYVYRLVTEYPSLKFTINGGIKSLAEVRRHLDHGVYGVMVGRAAYKTPWQLLGRVDSELYGVPDPGPTRRELLGRYGEYGDAELAANGRGCLNRVLKPVLNIFAGEPNGVRFKKVVEAERLRGELGVRAMLLRAAAEIPATLLDSPPPPPRHGSAAY